jgi:hypothetical protein
VELASQYVPPTQSRKATSIRSIPTPAWIVALALTLAPLALSLPVSNQIIDSIKIIATASHDAAAILFYQYLSHGALIG